MNSTTPHRIIKNSVRRSTVRFARCDCSAELTVYLRPDVRRRGYGRMLYTELEARLKAMGVRRAYACIAIPNGDDPYLTMDSPRFHEKMGYRRVGFFENCAEKFGRDYSMAWYEKVL